MEKKHQTRRHRNNLGESLKPLDPPKRLGVERLELYLGREPGEV